jgi:signal transduction histidine kinase
MTSHKRQSSGTGLARVYLFSLTLCMLAVGALFAWWMAARADRDLRANLLQQTRMVTQAVDMEQVKTLTGTEADLESPIYLRLKERFAAVKSANPKSRFVYLMGCRDDGTVFFFLDSEPAGSEDESPAGQAFNEVSAELRRAFETQTEIVEGPIRDSWGEWVSVLVPMTDRQNGKLVALLGMDIEARSWKWEIAAKVALPIGLALMLIGLSVSIFILAQSRRQILVNQETLRKSEEKYCILNADLELRIEERSRELMDAREELVRKEKLSILGQLSGSVGHELRNPLGVMSNAVYFLKMVLSDADDTVREYLDIIKHEIDTSLRIITDLLDFARTKAAQIQTVAVRALIDESLGRCTIPENVELRDELPQTLPPVKVDPLQVGQVLQNLIMNAVQAMPEGGVLTLRGEKEGQGPVRLEVADTGEGISPENMKKLFQPLFTTKTKGIGLGLVVCRNLAEANGGMIEVESEVGKGTTFTVILPVSLRNGNPIGNCGKEAMGNECI